MIWTPPLPPNPTATDRIVHVIDELLRFVEARAFLLGPVLYMRVYNRVRRLQRTFKSLVARVRAGVPARIRATRPDAPRPAPSPSAPSPSAASPSDSGSPAPPAREKPLRLPSKFAWLCLLVPCRAAATGIYLQNLLTTDAEMMALVASDPRFGRILRPLFHMLGRPPPPCVPKLPPRARRPRAVTQKAPRPIKPVTGRALLKYLPWKGPRPLPTIKARGADGQVVPPTSQKSKA